MGTLTIEPGQLDDAARAAYAKAWDEKRDTTGGLGDMEACLADAKLFDVRLGGQIVARYALRQVERAKGVEVFILAAVGSLPGVDLVSVVAPHIEKQCARADRLAINTRRPGLVKKLKRQGWTLDAYVMRKKL